MHLQLLASLPCVARDRGLANVGDLLDHVQFAQPIRHFDFAAGTHQILLMLLAHVLQVPQPVVTEAKPIPAQRGLDSTATVVAADDNVSHLQEIHCELHH